MKVYRIITIAFFILLTLSMALVSVNSQPKVMAQTGSAISPLPSDLDPTLADYLLELAKSNHALYLMILEQLKQKIDVSKISLQELLDLIDDLLISPPKSIKQI
jgi:hypothetical protein